MIVDLPRMKDCKICRGFIKFVSRWWKLKVGGGALRAGMGHWLGYLGTGGHKGSGLKVTRYLLSNTCFIELV